MPFSSASPWEMADWWAWPVSSILTLGEPEQFLQRIFVLGSGQATCTGCNDKVPSSEEVGEKDFHQNKACVSVFP